VDDAEYESALPVEVRQPIRSCCFREATLQGSVATGEEPVRAERVAEGKGIAGMTRVRVSERDVMASQSTHGAGE